YRKKNDIKKRPIKYRNDSPLRTADIRISHSWHGLLVNQKSGYMVGREPIIDVKDKELNKKIINTLGDEWGKTLRDLVVNASNKAIAWLHYWIEDKNFQYGIVPSEQIIPIYSNDLKHRLTAVIRKYRNEDENNNKYITYEYWTDKECFYFKRFGSVFTTLDCVKTNNIVSNSFIHSFGKVPFVYFNNNSILEGDLYMYKDLIDQFDNVTSGFANDIEDVQEIVFILKGYGGEDLEEFMKDLKDFKAVKTDDNGDVKTIKAEIPVEAREKFLQDIKKSIFLFGMGVNPDNDKLGDTSGVALKFLYSLLEIKATATISEFECSIKVLVRAILDFLNQNKHQDISITFNKTMITNDKETVDIISKSDGVISNKTKTKYHPYTDNLDEELEAISNEENDKDFDERFGADPIE
ncbi:MAG TPA: phage portal protein, partial [Clostridiales bacterium]|nr:phage portal protein [Clostridiales bacterium]